MLGCAGMADLAKALGDKFGVPVLDGVVCAVALAESMAALGLAHVEAQHLRHACAPKPYAGAFARFAPR